MSMINKLICADSFELMQHIQSDSIDLILTDPPYGCTDLHWDKKINLEKFWIELKRIIKPNGVIICFSQQPFTSKLIQGNQRCFRHEIIWEKSVGTGFLNVRHKPIKAHENILIFSQPGKKPTYNPQMTVGTPYSRTSGGSGGGKHWGKTHEKVATENLGVRYPRSVVKFAAQQKGNWHPTQKPYELIKNLLLTYSNRGDIVLDPFAGSCVVAKAARASHRNFIVVERDLDYCLRASEELNLQLCRIKPVQAIAC